MREDIIKQIAALDSINHVIVLTHNIDFVFLQTVFLSALKRCGHPGLTIFADDQCARESYRVQSSLITGLGKRFRVVPVSMNSGYRFHPKAIFLASDDRAVLFVGSGNMTFGGFRGNAEIWNRFDTQNHDYGVLAAFKNYLFELPSRVPFQESVQSELMELFDVQNYGWVHQLPEPSGLIGRISKANSLISQMQFMLENASVSSITVSVPYFDPEAKALKKIAELYPDSTIDVFLQSGQSTLFAEAAKNLPSRIKLKSIGFADPKNNNVLPRFIHAKYYGFHHDGQVDVFAGSANCSIAALVKDGNDGNAELLVYENMRQEEFAANFLNEFVVVDEKPELVSQKDAAQEHDCNPVIKLLAARFDIDVLKVCYECPNNTVISACYIDGEVNKFESNQSKELLIRTVKLPHTVLVNGTVGDRQVISNTIWVDHESSLRSTSKGRALLERIRLSNSGQKMQAEDWMLIVELFARDLEYTTAKEFHRNTIKKESDKDENKTVITRSDVFSNTYDKTPDFSKGLMNSFSSANINIYDLLLHAFGISSDHDAVYDQQMSKDLDDEDIVDKPENLNIQPKARVKKIEINDRVKRRINKVVNAIIESFTNPTYLELREPEGLSRDLQIAGLVLRKGLSEDWINSDQFFEATQKIWAKLFFSTKPGESLGWLGIRYQKEENQERFIKSLATPQLAATLFAWAIAVDLSKCDAFYQRFLSSLLLSMGRFPWLWHNGLDKEELYLHLKKILEDSPCEINGKIDIDTLHKRRISLLRQGVSLANADFYLSQQDIVNIRCQLSDRVVDKGDLLWQGKRGLCISLQNSVTSGDNVKVLCLQDPEGEVLFDKEFLLPIIKIIEAGLIPETDSFGLAQKNELLIVLNKFRSMQVRD